MQIIQKKKIWFAISGTLVAVSLLALLIWGLNPGIDFTGGSLSEFQFSESRPENNDIRETLKDFDLGKLEIATAGEKNAILRFKDVTEDQHQEIIKAMQAKYKSAQEASFESIGPVVGAELKKKSISALIIVSIAIILYIAWAFRKVSEPVKSWKYGVAAVIALIHDVAIVAGLFAILGKFWGVQVGVSFIAALLTILGYSVNDTIVVFDRTRENLAIDSSADYEDVVNQSVNETIARSLNTSLTTFFAIFAVFLFGGETTKYFMLALMVGCIVGTYSSIFIASPIVVIWEKLKRTD